MDSSSLIAIADSIRAASLDSSSSLSPELSLSSSSSDSDTETSLRGDSSLLLLQRVQKSGSVWNDRSNLPFWRSAISRLNSLAMADSEVLPQEVLPRSVSSAQPIVVLDALLFEVAAIVFNAKDGSAAESGASSTSTEAVRGGARMPLKITALNRPDLAALCRATATSLTGYMAAFTTLPRRGGVGAGFMQGIASSNDALMTSSSSSSSSSGRSLADSQEALYSRLKLIDACFLALRLGLVSQSTVLVSAAVTSLLRLCSFWMSQEAEEGTNNSVPTSKKPFSPLLRRFLIALIHHLMLLLTHLLKEEKERVALPTGVREGGEIGGDAAAASSSASASSIVSSSPLMIDSIFADGAIVDTLKSLQAALFEESETDVNRAHSNSTSNSNSSSSSSSNSRSTLSPSTRSGRPSTFFCRRRAVSFLGSVAVGDAPKNISTPAFPLENGGGEGAAETYGNSMIQRMLGSVSTAEGYKTLLPTGKAISSIHSEQSFPPPIASASLELRSYECELGTQEGGCGSIDCVAGNSGGLFKLHALLSCRASLSLTASSSSSAFSSSSSSSASSSLSLVRAHQTSITSRATPSYFIRGQKKTDEGLSLLFLLDTSFPPSPGRESSPLPPPPTSFPEVWLHTISFDADMESLLTRIADNNSGFDGNASTASAANASSLQGGLFGLENYFSSLQLQREGEEQKKMIVLRSSKKVSPSLSTLKSVSASLSDRVPSSLQNATSVKKTFSTQHLAYIPFTNAAASTSTTTTSVQLSLSDSGYLFHLESSLLCEYTDEHSSAASSNSESRSPLPLHFLQLSLSVIHASSSQRVAEFCGDSRQGAASFQVHLMEAPLPSDQSASSPSTSSSSSSATSSFPSLAAPLELFHRLVAILQAHLLQLLPSICMRQVLMSMPVMNAILPSDYLTGNELTTGKMMTSGEGGGGGARART